MTEGRCINRTSVLLVLLFMFLVLVLCTFKILKKKVANNFKCQRREVDLYIQGVMGFSQKCGNVFIYQVLILKHIFYIFPVG